MNSTLPPAPFWFLRHGETDYNARGLSQGATDIELNETGRAQAAAAAPVLQDQGITAIFASPMRRARETAQIVNQTLRLPLHFEPELREVVFGGMEGKPLLPWFAEWLEGRATPAGAESFADVTIRISAAMGRVLAHSGPVLIVAHGGVFRAMRGLMGAAREGLTPNGVPLLCTPDGGGWTITRR